MITSEIYDHLCELARQVASQAYAPYSNFHVGVAICDESGNYYTGCNVENASYGLTICAERNAIHHAISQGSRHIIALVIAADKPVPPCGACRQVMTEFMPEDSEVWSIGRNPLHPTQKWAIGHLMPECFTFKPST